MYCFELDFLVIVVELENCIWMGAFVIPLEVTQHLPQLHCLYLGRIKKFLIHFVCKSLHLCIIKYFSDYILPYFLVSKVFQKTKKLFSCCNTYIFIL